MIFQTLFSHERLFHCSNDFEKIKNKKVNLKNGEMFTSNLQNLIKISGLKKKKVK